MTPKKDEYMRGYGDGFKDGLAQSSAQIQMKPCEKYPERYCNCEGFYPACREAPASTASKAVQS